MRGHDAALSAVPYFLNLGLARAAVTASCHFADLGGNNTVVRQELALAKEAERRGVAIAPDCGLSPAMASILGGELVRRLGGRADALRLYVGGLPAQPTPPFHYQLVFSVEGLINEYVEPARILRKGKLTTIDPLTEPEDFNIPGFAPLVAFHTSGGTSTLPETFEGRVGSVLKRRCAILAIMTCCVSSTSLDCSPAKRSTSARRRSPPRHDVENFRGEICLKRTGRLHHAP
jgi:lysine 6-dehydrogenase